MAKPKLALIPAAQGTSLYSVLPSSGVGDFNFTRSGSATRINSQGLIETVASGVSRLNYPMIDGVVKGCPHHILEPQRTNLIQYSEDFSNASWTKTGATTVISNTVISPDGTLNASTVSGLTGSGSNDLVFSSGINPASKTYSASFYLKGNGTLRLQMSNNVDFGISETITLTSDWKRHSLTGTFNSTSGSLAIILDDFIQLTATQFDIYGAMLEEGSYPTSYIPNYGTSGGVTRSAETANGSGDAATFNDSEGVLMFEGSALISGGSTRVISLSSGSQSVNNIYISFNPTGGINCQVLTSGGNNGLSTTNINQEDTNKILLKYKANDFALWLNGFEVDTETSLSSTPIGLDRLNFDFGSGSFDFHGNTKQIQYYDTALTDSELETLTSWVSFTDMAESQLYSIE